MTSTATLPVTVKTEHPDEAEIQALAAKMVEANKAKAQPATQPRPISSMPAGPTGQVGIVNFLTRKAGAPVNDKKSGEKSEESKASDESSLRGQFGWAEIGKFHIPYILRQGEMYCAVHMVETKLLNKYLNYLHQDIYSCTCIRSYYITDAESKLLNEINIRHCDSQFGREYFTVKDLVVRLSDANEFYQFLDVCYKKLLDNSNNPKDKCGFIRINGESVVPYTVRGGQKFVPLFYFEGETDNLKLKADSLEGWDLSYLKFCCKVQGIRNELFASETCAVISLSDIKSYFPPGTNFEDYWPSKVMDSQLLVTSKGAAPQHVGHWTRQPAGPPPRGAAPQVTVQKAVTRRAAVPVQPNVQRMTHPIQNPGSHAGISATAAQVQERVMALNGWPGIVGGQQQAFQAQQVLRMAQHAAQQQAQSQTAQQVHAQQQAQQQAVQQQQAQLRAAYQKTSQVQAAAARHYQQQQQYANNTNNSAMAMAMVASQQQPPPLVRTNQQNNIGSPSMQRASVGNGRTTMVPADIGSRLTSIPDTPTSGNHIPYKVQKALVENIMVPSINMKPYVYTELLMTIADLQKHFFPSVSLVHCRQALDALAVELFKGNRTQMQILLDNGKCSSPNEILPLVQVRDVMQYMPQLKYMIISSEGAHPSKRSRIS